MPEPHASAPLDPSHSTQSPKRKRGLPAISTIPPTPPRSSPAAEDLLITPDHSAKAMCARPVPSIPQPIQSHIDTRGVDEERDEGENSPRTKVANKFQELGLQESKVSRLDLGTQSIFRGCGTYGAFDEIPNGEEEVTRKRVKIQAPKTQRSEIPETPQPGRIMPGHRQQSVRFFIGQEWSNDTVEVEAVMREDAKSMALSNEVDTMVIRGSPVPIGDLGLSYSQINKSPDSKSSKKRAWTPDVSEAGFTRKDVGNGDTVDEDRAALTWHDDEITGHDPTDPDDDGVGINGIGFKPTAAEAEKRRHQRRQQMAEYKTREMREARKSRMDRRKGSAVASVKAEQESSRRVRFTETEATTIST
ncbi:hypothetical protein QTJ16_001897 [Diplocarpon rosae]|uniref:Uncharacterized protein n=1 Tax=Diplocarpon rosae TaxID=946125 RepID=A0AAD9T565_9HELO|nr:hypothetical protein QTJ16_001897 [Diplocarpon rosae]